MAENPWPCEVALSQAGECGRQQKALAVVFNVSIQAKY